MDAFTSRQAESEAVSLVFRRNKDGFMKANRQLGRAREKHAEATILLLDRSLTSRQHIDVIRKALSPDPALICNIGRIYVVDIRQNRVTMVWPGGVDD